MTYKFLRLEWRKSRGAQYEAAAKQLMRTWINNITDPLQEVCSIMEWLPNEANNLQKPKSFLLNLPSVNKTIFPVFIKQLLEGLRNRHSIEDSSEVLNGTFNIYL